MGKTALIVCDGQFPKKEYPRYIIRNADIIVCCDGAAGKFLRHSKAIFGSERMPDVVIGDMDSISLAMKKSFQRLLAQSWCMRPNRTTMTRLNLSAISSPIIPKFLTSA